MLEVSYYLLKELPFLESGTSFVVYDVINGQKYFYTDRSDGTGRLFNPYENGILRSILEQTDWVERIEEGINIFEDEAKAAFRETYTSEWIAHMELRSTAELNIVEIMYQAFVSGYFAAMAEHYKG